MAKTDLVFLPPAWATSRSAMETAARTQWLLDPKDEWEREARYLALLKEGVRLGERGEFGNANPFANRSASIDGFATTVTQRLPAGYEIPRIPTSSRLLAAFAPHMDTTYVVASQFVHGTELATGQFRAQLGDGAVYGEHIEVSDWLLPLVMAWNSFRSTAVALSLANPVGAIQGPLDQADIQVEKSVKALLETYG